VEEKTKSLCSDQKFSVFVQALTSTLRHLNLIVGGALGLIATGYVLAGVVFCDMKNHSSHRPCCSTQGRLQQNIITAKL
jgi:hypothetical protein